LSKLNPAQWFARGTPTASWLGPLSVIDQSGEAALDLEILVSVIHILLLAFFLSTTAYTPRRSFDLLNPLIPRRIYYKVRSHSIGDKKTRA
jgi:hypothetical protein